MSEAAEATSKKPKTEVTNVKMEDGREVGFPGKRKVDKEYLIDETKIALDGDSLLIQPGAVRVRLDLINGSTRTFDLPLKLFAQFAGHGGIQKYGDELATTADKPLSPEDMVLALENLDARIQSGNWGRERDGDGFSGASDIAKAVVEAQHEKGVEIDLKAAQTWLNETFGKYSAAAEAKGEKFTRQKFYAAFRNPASATGRILERMAREKLSQGAAFDANAEMEGLKAA